MILGRDPMKTSFSQVTNKNKLANGCHPWQGLVISIQALKFDLKYLHGQHRIPEKLLELSGTTNDQLLNMLSELKEKIK